MITYRVLLLWFQDFCNKENESVEPVCLESFDAISTWMSIDFRIYYIYLKIRLVASKMSLISDKAGASDGQISLPASSSSQHPPIITEICRRCRIPASGIWLIAPEWNRDGRRQWVFLGGAVKLYLCEMFQFETQGLIFLPVFDLRIPTVSNVFYIRFCKSFYVCIMFFYHMMWKLYGRVTNPGMWNEGELFEMLVATTGI